MNDSRDAEGRHPGTGEVGKGAAGLPTTAAAMAPEQLRRFGGGAVAPFSQMLVVGLVVGVVIGIIQAATQLNEPTIAFIALPRSPRATGVEPMRSA